jgi:hypothetical protein
LDNPAPAFIQAPQATAIFRCIEDAAVQILKRINSLLLGAVPQEILLCDVLTVSGFRCCSAVL